ncbi:uncharacterized protein K02A2.6-like [Armigeres subalbatus]|uniref:uncharacterized protein K02A2.6-like n=1 Tax=Armigeres subalbatus TaxID=124917 RepID=UPI002ED3B68F
MRGATVFCHLDVTDAYTHLPIDEEFSHILTLNTTTHGLIRPTRAVYGAANIPAIRQRRMESVLQGLDDVVVNFYDDIIVFAKDFVSLLQALTVTLDRLRTSGLRLNRTKCVFATSSLECLGHRIDRHGLHKSEQHVEAVRNAPRPTTPDELQLFLARCLRIMLLADSFEWTADAEKAYLDLKEASISPQVLMQYDPTLPLILETGASQTGLGAVLSHRLQNGLERPIAYASTALSNTEQRYPQIDKEALAIVWAVKRFFHYLYAKRFTFITDHKPLTQILHPEKSLPSLCISRMANYADYLAHFDFNIVYKPTKEHTNADYCSRIPNKVYPIANCLHFEHIVVIPPTLRQAILNDLHAAHLGVVKMKSIARSFVYWPGIDSDIEKAVRSCSNCARNAPAPPKFSTHHWEYPKGPWERIHIDYAGPVADTMLLIIVDAYSKWVEVKTTSTSNTAATISILDDLFSTYGAPTTLVTEAEFKRFLQMSGVKYHKLSTPYHPSINGHAERYVQTVKQKLKSMGTTKGTLKANNNEFLRQYRKTAHSKTAESPGKLFFRTQCTNPAELG